MPDGSTAPNAKMTMSPEAKLKMRNTEKAVHRYYNDMGKNKGHCTWGAGILVHRGVCTKAELGKKVSAADVNAAFDRKVGEAERAVKRNVSVQLNQAQFDAIVSFTYNTGAVGAMDTYTFLNQNDFAGAAANMQQFVKVRVKTKSGTKKIVAGGLVKRRAEESAPFLAKSAADATGR